MKCQFLIALVALCAWLDAVHAQSANRPAIFPQLGHAGEVKTVAFAPDGKLFASGSADHTIKLWDVASGRELRTLSGSSDAVNSIAFAPGGKLLASGSGDTVKIWGVRSGRELNTLSGYGPVAFTPNGKMLASQGPNHSVILWDIASWRKVRAMTGHTGGINAVAFSPDGRRIASGSKDGDIRLWSVANGRALRTLNLHSGWYDVLAVSFSPNGKFLASVNDVSDIEKNFITLWDTSNGHEVYSRLGGDGIAFSPDGKLLAFDSHDYEDKLGAGLKLIDVVTGDDTRVLKDAGAPVAFSPDGKVLASGIALWDTSSWHQSHVLSGHTQGPDSIAFAPDGKVLTSVRRIYANSRYENVNTTWDIRSGHDLGAAVAPAIEDVSVDGSPSNAKLLALACNQDHGKRSWSISPDKKMLACNVGPSKGSIAFFDVSSGQQLRTSDLSKCVHNALSEPTFSPNGLVAASMADFGNTMMICDVASGRVLHSVTGDSRVGYYTECFAFSPDGKMIASGGNDNYDGYSVVLWDVQSGRGSVTLHTHGYMIQEATPLYWHKCHLAFSRDGKSLTLFDGDHYDPFALWNVSNGRELIKTSGVESFVESPDQTRLATANSDHTISLWDTSTGANLQTLRGHSGRIGGLAFSPDGTQLASSSEDGTIRLWSVATGNTLASLIVFTDGSSIAVTPEGFFDASNEMAEENLNVRIGDRVFGISSFREHFYRPDLVQKALAGESLQQFGSIGDVKLSPVIDFVDLPTTTTNPDFKLNLRLTNGGGGMGPVRLFSNGTIIEQDNDVPASSETLTRSYTVPLFPGSNDLRVSALNAEGSMFSDTTATVTANLPAPAKLAGVHGTLHAVVVGIQHFPNAPSNDLAYPAADAQLIAKTLTEKAGPLFEKLDIRLLKPEETDRAHVVSALKAVQASVGPDDAFVFYVASHGIVAGDGQYYIMMSDAASPEPAILKQHAISSAELLDLLANIKVTKKLAILDTCDAGNVLADDQKAQDKLTILGRSGLNVLAATASNQEALEGGYKDHGLFTYVVNDGLAGRAADAAGVVDSFLLADYVSKQVAAVAQTAFHRAQQPTWEPNGQAFPITKVR